MQKLSRALCLGAAVALSLFGCDDPADDVPTAHIQEGASPAPDPANESEAEAIGAPARGEALSIDVGRSTFGFVGSKPTGTQEGSFGEWTGSIDLREPFEGTAIVIEIQMNSVQTESERLTTHLESVDFFDAEQFPTARFESTGFGPAPDDAENATHLVTGRLTMRGQMQTIAFPVRMDVSAGEVRGRAEFSIDRTRWGIVYPGMSDDLIRDAVVIRFDVRAPRG